jgi:hypothetical protein
MFPTRSGYTELGLDLVSLLENHFRELKKPPMVEEKRDDREKYPFKTPLKESLV